MDKDNALKISKEYLRRLQSEDLNFSEAWLFGSYARGSQHDNSDIDIAIVFKENIKHTFEIEVKLMVLRKGEETLIEPHAFSKDEFDYTQPIVNQIITYGEKIKL